MILVNINDIKGKMFTECPLPYEGWFFFVENTKSQKKITSAWFSQRGSQIILVAMGQLKADEQVVHPIKVLPDVLHALCENYRVYWLAYVRK